MVALSVMTREVPIYLVLLIVFLAVSASSSIRGIYTLIGELAGTTRTGAAMV